MELTKMEIIQKVKEGINNDKKKTHEIYTSSIKDSLKTMRMELISTTLQ